MKYENTIIHIINDNIEGEFKFQISYNPEDNKIKFHASYGNVAILNGIRFDEIVKLAIMQENYVRFLDRELNKEVSPEENHIYINVCDYLNNYDVYNVLGKKKELKTR